MYVTPPPNLLHLLIPLANRYKLCLRALRVGTNYRMNEAGFSVGASKERYQEG